MELVREHWTKEDAILFREFESSLYSEKSACEWEKRIINTSLDCLGRSSEKAKTVVPFIKKGNFYEFLDVVEIKTNFDSFVFAALISAIKDPAKYEKRLFNFALTVDNWASADVLDFKGKDKDALCALSKSYRKHPAPFVRRIGLRMIFELIKDERFLDTAFFAIDELIFEREYYVNMCGAWLLAECFIKHRDKTLAFFANTKTNDFVVNKAISKCRDSFRVSKSDKDLLLKYKR